MASLFGFAHLWQQSELSDIELVLAATGTPPDSIQPAATEAGQAAARLSTTYEVLARFPAHCAILTNSDFFRAQINRWLHKRARPDDNADGANSDGNASSSTEPAKRQLVLTLDTADELPAALTVLQALYGVQPLPELLNQLPQELQLQAAVLADKWTIPSVSTGAVKAIKPAASAPTGTPLTDATLDLFLSLPAHPACLLPLLPDVVAVCWQQDDGTPQAAARMSSVKKVLLALLGDLEEVWGNAVHQETLLQLPLDATEWLLSSNELRVASEDTVLYTAQRYVDNISVTTPGTKAIAKHKLAAVVRCIHLSDFWLSVSAMSADNSLLLHVYQKQLRQMLLVVEADRLTVLSYVQPGGPSDRLKAVLPKAPANWFMPVLVLHPIARVSWTWELDISTLKAAAVEAAAKRRTRSVEAAQLSPPLGGVAWSLFFNVAWPTGEEGCTIGLFMKPKTLPDDAYVRYRTQVVVEAGGTVVQRWAMKTPFAGNKGLGCTDFFGVGAMPGGWDDAALAAKQVPAAGTLRVSATVYHVAHVEAKKLLH